MYKHKDIESKWQKVWEKEKLYSPRIVESKVRKFYNLWMFPYPSAEGLHSGHAFASTGSDVFGRYMRMNGYSVFQPIGYDSFGIHTENFAIKTGEQPEVMLKRTTKNYERQLRSLGHGYDWERTVTTSNIEYYKWTQWLFVEMFKSGLAYKKKAQVNWCPGCKTVLADEQIMTPAQAGKTPPGYNSIDEVPEGIRVCERCGSIPERRELSQWFFRITDYAQRLLENLDIITWSERVKLAQKEWIGRKEGINITYKVKGTENTVVCFTTRPDTNYGATFIVVSPEYAASNLMAIISKDFKKKVSEYIESSLKKSEQQRQEEGRTKTGVFTGLYAINMLNNEEMPIWVSDFVLSGFGTGAVVGVPGHDKRDFEFASTFGIPVKRVVIGADGDTSEIKDIKQIQEENGKMINSDFLDGMDIHEATKKIMDYLEEKGWGKKQTTYHLRDWLISRQRYWGPPIPMIYCEHCAKEGKSWFNTNSNARSSLLRTNVASREAAGNQNLNLSDQDIKEAAGWYPDENLPVKLPQIEDYKPKGEGTGPLADHPEFYKVSCPHCGRDAKRETDVSDTFLDSAWYFLRYPSVDSKTKGLMAFDPEVTKTWLPVDLYFGGAEHSVLHLMYARFVWMTLYDLGYFKFSSKGRPASGWEEPFPKFFAHGLMIKDGAKMSKSKGNVVNPDEYIEKYGADTLRLYTMFIGPMDGYPDFRDTGIEGMGRFVKKVYDLLRERVDLSGNEVLANELTAKVHKTIQKVTEDIKEYRYNTAISSIMELVNLMKTVSSKAKNGESGEWTFALETLAKLLAPFAPHMTEEIWRDTLKHNESIHISTWPQFDKDKTTEREVIFVVQVNGKHRASLVVSKEISENKVEIEKLALEEENVGKWIKGKTSKVIFVPGKIINFVV